MGGNGSGRHPKLCPCDYCKTSQRVQSQPDPRDASNAVTRFDEMRAKQRIAELEREMKDAHAENYATDYNELHDRHVKVRADRDRLQAEVERLRDVARRRADMICALNEDRIKARRALEYYATSLKPPYDMADDGKRAREALAAVEHKKDYATANAPENAPRDTESAKQDAAANEPVTNCRAASPRSEAAQKPSASEHAALLRVAEAAEGVGMNWKLGAPYGTDELHDALAELRRAREVGDGTQ